MLELAVSSLTYEGFQNTQYEDLFAKEMWNLTAGMRNRSHHKEFNI